jgi:hypothetical protein
MHGHTNIKPTGFWDMFKTLHSSLASLLGMTEQKQIIVLVLTFATDIHTTRFIQLKPINILFWFRMPLAGVYFV